MAEHLGIVARADVFGERIVRLDARFKGPGLNFEINFSGKYIEHGPFYILLQR